MTRKSPEIMWFGCPACKYEPPKDEKMSNENWSVYQNEPCPLCGKDMRINFETPPPEILEKRKQNKENNP